MVEEGIQDGVESIQPAYDSYAYALDIKAFHFWMEGKGVAEIAEYTFRLGFGTTIQPANDKNPKINENHMNHDTGSTDAPIGNPTPEVEVEAEAGPSQPAASYTKVSISSLLNNPESDIGGRSIIRRIDDWLKELNASVDSSSSSNRDATSKDG